MAPPSYNPDYHDWDDDDVDRRGKPYWALLSGQARDGDEGPTNNDYFTYDWESFRNNFRDETIYE